MQDDITLFISNIHPDTTVEMLKHLCCQIGPISELKLKQCRFTGKSLCYGFVVFKEARSAMFAQFALNNFEVNNQRLKVDFPNK